MFLEIENEVYALDLDEIVKFILEPHSSKNVESSQTLVYSSDEEDENKLKLISKQLTENKNNDNANNIDAIKYDLTKQLLDVIMGIGVKTNPFGEVVEQDSSYESLVESVSVGEAIAFNTFLNKGFLINVK